MIGYIVIGVIVFLLLGSTVGRKLLPLPTWRIGAGMGAIAALAAGGYFAVRNSWPLAATFIFIGLWLAMSSRLPRRSTVHEKRRAQEPARRPNESMSASEARSILGVSETATREEIQTAYKRLMIRVHPDNGGAPGLAVKLNAARDRLLKG